MTWILQRMHFLLVMMKPSKELIFVFHSSNLPKTIQVLILFQDVVLECPLVSYWNLFNLDRETCMFFIFGTFPIVLEAPYQVCLLLSENDNHSLNYFLYLMFWVQLMHDNAMCLEVAICLNT